MAEPVYGIDDFPDDDSLWRVEWIGGVGYNTSVPSDPRITVCLTQLPPGETNPLSARARSWQTKTTAKISVGLLPYISIVSVWQRRRPVVTNLGACHQLRPWAYGRSGRQLAENPRRESDLWSAHIFSAAAFLPSRLSNLRRSGRAATLCRIVSAWGCFLILLLKHCNRTSSTTAATSGRSALR